MSLPSYKSFSDFFKRACLASTILSAEGIEGRDKYFSKMFKGKKAKEDPM